ncbi:MAG: clan AA aspartic protease [Planctomycetes bacterium]|nr:clan AA aspartic protease [Planctomycetota bacterium]
MITGSVNSDLEGILRITVRGPNGKRKRITAVIDTGYNGSLTLPLELIADLGLPWRDTGSAMLGDGSICECDIYASWVVWNRRTIGVFVEEANTTPLVGMELLRGFELNMKVERHGQVTIKPMRRRPRDGRRG